MRKALPAQHLYKACTDTVDNSVSILLIEAA